MTCPIRAVTDLEAFLLEPGGPMWEAFRAHYLGCPECSAELARWSELEEILRVAAARDDSPHPSEAHLLAFREDPSRLAPADRDSIGDHLRACPVCRDGLAAAVGFGVRPARSAHGSFRTALRGPARSLGRRLPRLLLAAAAVLLLALPVSWLLRARLDRPLDPPRETASELAAVEPPAPPESPRAGLPEESASSRVEEESGTPAPGSAGEKQPHEPVGSPSRVSETRPKEPPRVVASPSAPAAPDAPAGAGEVKPPATKEGQETSRVLIVAALAALPPPLYVPPQRGAPAVRVSGGTRSALPDLPKLLALAPEHEGRTTSESPTLYWFVSRETNLPCEFVLTHPDRVDPVVEVTSPAPISAGIHALRLSDHGIVLEPDTPYRWFVSLVSDPGRRSSDVVAGGVIRRVALDERLRAELEEGGPARAGHVYARNGLFYDALAFVSRWIQEAPDEPRLREQRAALLEQVGLREAAGARRAPAERSIR